MGPPASTSNQEMVPTPIWSRQSLSWDSLYLSRLYKIDNKDHYTHALSLWSPPSLETVFVGKLTGARVRMCVLGDRLWKTLGVWHAPDFPQEGKSPHWGRRQGTLLHIFRSVKMFNRSNIYTQQWVWDLGVWWFEWEMSSIGSRIWTLGL